MAYGVPAPLKRDKLFVYGSYQYTRDRDQVSSQDRYYAPSDLTADRSETGMQSVVAAAGLPAGTAIDPVALNVLQFKLISSQYPIRNPQAGAAQESFLGPASKFDAAQANGNSTMS